MVVLLYCFSTACAAFVGWFLKLSSCSINFWLCWSRFLTENRQFVLEFRLTSPWWTLQVVCEEEEEETEEEVQEIPLLVFVSIAVGCFLSYITISISIWFESLLYNPTYKSALQKLSICRKMSWICSSKHYWRIKLSLCLNVIGNVWISLEYHQGLLDLLWLMYLWPFLRNRI